MLHCRIHIKHLLPVLIIATVFSSCASYNRQVSGYYSALRQGNYQKAAKALDNNRLLGKDRNRLLFLLERGKVCHLLQQWDSSNTYFNEADQRMEDAKTSAMDVVAGNLLNPMMKGYKAEDFEKYLVHYYKALNYLQLNQPEEAMVEARRITLRTNTQEDKVGNGDKYGDDAFSLMMQGVIYEKNGDVNNAFISYRNAADVYLKNDGSYYGIKMPLQLKKDLLRTADQNGFTDELGRYEQLFDITYQEEERPEGGELIVFWENGSAPVKVQQDIWFSLIKNSGGFFFTDPAGLYNVPFDDSRSYNSGAKLEDLRSFRVALPKYQAQPVRYSGASLQLNNRSFPLEPAEDVNNLAFATLKERMLKELSSTLTRLAIKKLAEAAVRPNGVKDDPKKSEEQRKKEQKQKNQQEALALGLQLFNFASEKADTRNWQSLPHTIFYTRIPLAKGTNAVTLQLNGSSPQAPVIFLGNGGLQFWNICTLQ